MEEAPYRTRAIYSCGHGELFATTARDPQSYS